MKVNVKPLADRVLIEPAPAEQKHQEALLFLTQQKKNLKRNSSGCWKRKR